MALGSQMQKLLTEEAMIRRQPITANFELLPVCNLKCKMCYIHTDMTRVREMGGLKSADDWISLAKQMREAGTLFLLLTGGEAFLYPGFKQLYIELYKMGFLITINTNGTMIDENAVEWLRQYPPKLVSMSLYGASDETYERICGQPGMFRRVDRAARLLQTNHIRFEFKTMLTPLNVCDADACFAYARQLGVYHEQASYAFPSARKQEIRIPTRFSPEEAAENRIAVNKRVSLPEQFRQGIVDHLQKYTDTKNRCGGELHGFTCGATRSSSWITWQGHMTPCALIEGVYTLPFEQGFLPAWEELKQKCDQILMSPKCSHCDKRAVCTICPAANLAETGSFEESSPYHCRMTEHTLEEMMRLVEEWKIEVELATEKEETP